MAVSYKFSIPKVEKIEEISGKSEVLSKVTYAVQAQSTEFLETSILLTKELELDYSTLEEFTEYPELDFNTLVEWILLDQGVSSIGEIDIVVEAVAKIKAADFESANKTVKKEYDVYFGIHRSVVE